MASQLDSREQQFLVSWVLTTCGVCSSKHSKQRDDRPKYEQKLYEEKQGLTSKSPYWGAAGQPTLPLMLVGTQETHKKDTQYCSGLKLQKLPPYQEQELCKKIF